MADISKIKLPDGTEHSLKDSTARNDISGKVSKAGDTMTGNIIVPAGRVANTYYGISFGRTTGTPVETILYTGIKWASGAHMPVVHITGYAYGLQSPVEFKIGFYIYNNKIGYCGVTNMGSWSPDVYLFKHTRDNVEYVAVGLAGACYFLQLSADVQDEMGKFAYTVTDSAAWTWSFLTTAGTIPADDSGTTCIKVPYKANILKPANAVLADKATGDKNGNDITTTYTPLSSGFGRWLSGVIVTDWNTINNTCSFYATSSANAKPPGTDHCGMQVAYSSVWKYQFAFDYRTDTIYTRACQNGTWHDWYPIYTTAKTIPVANGGTGATTAANARTNLGLGTAAVANLSTATNSTSTTTAATSSAVKTAYDLANTANGTANTALSGVNGSLIYDHTYTISNGVATFTPHVYCKGEEVTSQYAASCFSWKYRLDNNVTGTPSYVNLTTDSTTKGCTVTISTLGYGGHVIGTFTPPA